MPYSIIGTFYLINRIVQYSRMMVNNTNMRIHTYDGYDLRDMRNIAVTLH